MTAAILVSSSSLSGSTSTSKGSWHAVHLSDMLNEWSKRISCSSVLEYLVLVSSWVVTSVNSPPRSTAYYFRNVLIFLQKLFLDQRKRSIIDKIRVVWIRCGQVAPRSGTLKSDASCMQLRFSPISSRHH